LNPWDGNDSPWEEPEAPEPASAVDSRQYVPSRFCRRHMVWMEPVAMTEEFYGYFCPMGFDLQLEPASA
jgi:hypothetical protein